MYKFINKQNYHLGTNTRKQMIGLHPIIAFAVEMCIKDTKQDFCIVQGGGVRSDAYQNKLYQKGRSTKGPKVTWTRNSFHQYGLAVDLVAYVNGKPSWDPKYYTEIIESMKRVIWAYNLPIDHGYDLWGKDLPHWQITKLNETDARKIYDVRKLIP